MIGKKSLIIATLGAAIFFTGCGTSESKTVTYKLTFKNITASQPFAPAAVIVQNENTSFEAYTTGQAASVGLENLAEGGNPSILIDEAKAANVLYTNTLAGLQAPGSSKTISLTVDKGNLNLSLASMPVKTNDAFVGAKNISLDFTGTKTFNLNVYDAGTEANTETAASVPGLGGEGFNASRDDSLNQVSLHQGLVTADDGLATSGLSFSDKFDNPAATLTIERVY